MAKKQQVRQYDLEKAKEALASKTAQRDELRTQQVSLKQILILSIETLAPSTRLLPVELRKRHDSKAQQRSLTLSYMESQQLGKSDGFAVLTKYSS